MFRALRSLLNLGAENLRGFRDLGGPFEIREGQFLVRNWALGLLAAVLLAFGIARQSGDSGPAGRWRRLVRGVVAVAETGVFVVVPATAVWQAATAQGWTTTHQARLAVGVVAVSATLGVAAAVTVVGQRASARALIVPTALAAGFVLTGSGLVPLLGSALIELAPARSGRVDPVQHGSGAHSRCDIEGVK